jgi:hypothetical protein
MTYRKDQDVRITSMNVLGIVSHSLGPVQRFFRVRAFFATAPIVLRVSAAAIFLGLKNCQLTGNASVQRR